MSMTIALGLSSCNSDLESIFVQAPDDISLGGASGEIILSPNNPQALAMTLYWSGDGKLSLSDPLVQAPVNAADETIQLSADEAFANAIDLSVEKGVRSRQFLCEELNSLLGRLGFVANEKAPLYIRIKSVLAANVDPTYSEPLKVMVQSYRISLVVATVLNADKSDSDILLASPNEDGIYAGFMGVNGWTNWWLREANNLVWGNLGIEGMIFHASSADDHWNFWFPDPTGCYYTTVNTPEGWWSALYIEKLSVSGDVEGDMKYNQKENQWTLPVTRTSAGTVTIRISGVGKLYNKEIGCPI